MAFVKSTTTNTPKSAGGFEFFFAHLAASASGYAWLRTRPRETAGPKLVFIDPRHSFGRPVLARSRIATAIIAERYKAGDSIDDLVDDYACERLEVEEALRYELSLDAA